MVQVSDLVNQVDEANKQKATDQEAASKQAELVESNQGIQQSINEAVKTLLSYLAAHETKVTVNTPDMQTAIEVLKKLYETTASNKPDYSEVTQKLDEVVTLLTGLPSKLEYPEAPGPLEEVSVKNQIDYTPKFDELTSALQKEQKAPKVTVNVDTATLLGKLGEVVQAVHDITIPEAPETDFGPLQASMDAVKTAIQSLRFPVPNYVLPFMTNTGKATQVKLDANGNLPISGSISSAVTNDGTFAKEDGNLAILTAKDFATQTTLALIKAKTDNLDVATSTRTKPADQQHAIIDSSALPSGAATSANQLIGLVPKVYDYINADYSGSTSDVYIYKAGGSGGSTAATLTVNWTDATKLVLSTVVRT